MNISHSRGVGRKCPAKSDSGRGHDSLIALAIFAAMSTVSAIFLIIGASRQVALPSTSPAYTVKYPSAASPGYWGLMTNWDGQWYRSIAEHGYPVPLPTEGGVVAMNEWAFYPLYPLLVRGVMFVTRLEFAHSAWMVSVLCAAGAAILLFRLVVDRMGRFGAGALVACLFAYVTAPVLQVGYTESLALLLILLGLTALKSRRYGLFLLAALALSLARPISVALGITALLLAALRWRDARSGREQFPVRERLWAVATAVSAVALMGLWPLVTGLANGRLDAYVATQAAWPVNAQSLGPLGGWLPEVLALSGWGTIALAGGCAVGLIALRSGARTWGRGLHLWCAVYLLYLLAATRPGPSILRHSILMVAPFWPLAQLRDGGQESRATKVSRWICLLLLLCLGLVCQFLWTTGVFTIQDAPDSQLYP